MSTNRISPEAEQRLIDSVQQAIGLTNAGTDPSEAVAKVAADRGYNTDFTARMVEMYNTSRTLAHFKQASEGERAADFPLADLSKVAELLAGPAAAPAQVGELVSKVANFMHEAPLEKAASAPVLRGPTYDRYGVPVVARAVNGEQTLRRKIAQARTELSAARDERDALLRKIAQYFRQPGSMRFEEFETRVIGMHKRAGELLSSAVWEYLGNWQGREKRGSAPQRPLLTDFSAEPFNLLEPMFHLTGKLAQLRQELADLEQSAAGYRKTLHEKMAELQQLQQLHKRAEDGRNQGVPMYIEDEVDDERQEELLDEEQMAEGRPLKLQDSEEKAASPRPFVLSAETLSKEAVSTADIFRWEVGKDMIGALPMLAGESSSAGQVAKGLETATLGFDPVHEAELDAIEAEGVLQDLLATDPVISAYDPDEVLSAYNEVAHFAPNSVREPLVLRGYLRKYLESSGHPRGKVMEGFDVKQLQDMEKVRADRGMTLSQDLEKLQAKPPMFGGGKK